MLAGSMDRTLKLWDLNAGMQIATSRFQPSTVRALALDQGMLVCSASTVRSLLLISIDRLAVLLRISPQAAMPCPWLA